MDYDSFFTHSQEILPLLVLNLGIVRTVLAKAIPIESEAIDFFFLWAALLLRYLLNYLLSVFFLWRDYLWPLNYDWLEALDQTVTVETFWSDDHRSSTWQYEEDKY